MPKKGAAKQPKAKAASAPTAAAAAAAPKAEAEEDPKSYFDSLSPEEQKKEQEKQAERERKAQLQQQKQKDEQWKRDQNAKWEKQQALQNKQETQKVEKYSAAMRARAKAEGILESQDGGDGKYYVELPGKIWKEVPDVYWCPHCNASLNDAVLESHMEGEKHKKNLAWARGGAAPAAPAAAPAAAPKPAAAAAPAAGWAAPAAGAAARGGALEAWQALDKDGNIMCTLCNKICDGVHESSEVHLKRLEAWKWEQQAAAQEYPAPKLPWLAWVHEPAYGSGKYLKCLLCDKWVQDWDHKGSVDNYRGHHGDLCAANQKDHKRKLENYSSYKSWVEAERAKYHPPQRRAVATPQAKAAAGPAKAAPWAKAGQAADQFVVVNNGRGGQQAPAAQPPPPPPPPSGAPPLPEGWQRHWDEKSKKHYYHHAGKGETTWTMPEAEPTSRGATATAEADADDVEEC